MHLHYAHECCIHADNEDASPMTVTSAPRSLRARSLQQQPNARTCARCFIARCADAPVAGQKTATCKHAPQHAPLACAHTFASKPRRPHYHRTACRTAATHHRIATTHHCLPHHRTATAPPLPPPPPPPPQVKMAEDIDFKYPMRRACAWEISRFCANLPHGHARVIRCLQVRRGAAAAARSRRCACKH